MTDVGEAGNSQQMPYNHVSAEDPQNEYVSCEAATELQVKEKFRTSFGLVYI